ncbi:DUF4469 domain-containing protein [Candidatus Electrothrix sp.]|uniref:DUF4469 domain-containing protein n=1 Tax=Candidatus Electrothrix sp. TaxID=2170559 RepID=UPI004055B199
MHTIQWTPTVNALTTPQSYKIRFVPRNILGKDDIIARIAERQPNLSEEVIRTVMDTEHEVIQESLLDGDQVTLEDAFTYTLSFLGRLDSPDSPLPDRDDLLQVRIHASPPFVRKIRNEARLERVPMSKKMPLITSAEDTRLKLPNVLNPQGVLKLTGTNLNFDDQDPDCGCIISGTQSGQSTQAQFGMISAASVLVVPDIPAQANPWNNEYTVSISTQYTEHGTVRTGVYERMLRSPLRIDGFGPGMEYGILSGSGNSPYVSATSGMVMADEMLRIQAVLDIHEGHLLFSLLDMTEGGAVGPSVTVTMNGDYTLNGFGGSAVSGLNIRVNSFSELVDMIRNSYSGRLVDVLDVRV